MNSLAMRGSSIFTRASYHSRRHASTAIPRPFNEDDERRVYIIGLGNVGRLIGHSLRSLPEQPPVTYLSGDNKRLISFQEANFEIEIICNHISHVVGGFDIEVNGKPGPHKNPVGKIKYYRIRDFFLPDNFEVEQEGSRRPGPTQSEVHGASAGNLVEQSIRQQLPVLGVGTGRRRKKTVLRYSDAKQRSGKSKGVGVMYVNQILFPPIKNLIITGNITMWLDQIQRIKHRLCRDSTIVLVGHGLGILEKLSKEVFPDIKTRPSYYVALCRHNYREPGARGPTDIEDRPEPLMHAKIYNGNPFSTLFRDGGEMVIGPLAQEADPGSDSAQDLKVRKRQATYLIRLLCASPRLRARQITQEEIVRVRVRGLIMSSVVVPLSIKYHLRMDSLFRGEGGEERWREANAFLREAITVCRTFMPHLSMTRYQLYLRDRSKPSFKDSDEYRRHLNPSVLFVLYGKRTDLECVNGWIVNWGRKMGIPCPVNEQFLKTVDEITDQIRNIRADADEASRFIHRSQKTLHINGKDRLRRLEQQPFTMTRLEAKRWRKAERIRSSIGKQPMKDHTHPTSDPGLGTLQFRKVMSSRRENIQEEAGTEKIKATAD